MNDPFNRIELIKNEYGEWRWVCSICGAEGQDTSMPHTLQWIYSSFKTHLIKVHNMKEHTTNGIYDPRFQTLVDTLSDSPSPSQMSRNRKRKKGVHPLATNRLSGKQRRNQCIRLADRDGWICRWCKVDLSFVVGDSNNDTQELRYPTIDHITTKSRGGDNSDDNCVLSCRDCNVARSARNIERKFK